MSDEEIEKFYGEMQAHYGDSLANFEHHPRQFAHQVRAYKYFKSCEENSAKKSGAPEIIDFT